MLGFSGDFLVEKSGKEGNLESEVCGDWEMLDCVGGLYASTDLIGFFLFMDF